MANQGVPQHIMDECLSAGREGNIEALYVLIGSHPRVLDEIDSNPFAETPLHAAASAGHLLFAREIMQLKPSFRSKLNKNGFTPLHLALQEINKVDRALQKRQSNVDPEMLQAPPHADREGLYRMVSYLLRSDQKLACVAGKEGLTPLHYAAQMGNLDLLVSILHCCPKSILDVTNRDDTVLHVALKHNQLPAYRLLVLWLRAACGTDAFLHRRWLLERRNEEGKTYSDMAKDKNISQVDDRHIKRVIERGSSRHRLPSEVKNETRDALLVVLALLLSITFQTILCPPGGTWQDDYDCHGNNITCAAKPSHRAGTAIMGYGLYLTLIVFNLFSCFSLSGLFVSLLPGYNYNFDWFPPFCGLSVTFVLSVFTTYPGSKSLPPKFMSPILGVFYALIAFRLYHKFSFPFLRAAGEIMRSYFSR